MLASLFPWFLYMLALGSALIAVSNGALFWPNMLLYVVVFNGGLQGLWAALGHLVFPKETAKKIGWKTNGFQTEIGGANLAVGISGILCYWNRGWVTAISVVIAVFFSVAAYMHIKDIIKKQNTAPCNSGPMLYCTITVILTILFSWAVMA